MGKRLGDYESDCLTNLRFTDEVTGEAPKNDVRNSKFKTMIATIHRNCDFCSQTQHRAAHSSTGLAKRR